MTIKDKINEMIEQYSITHDNPTVLRELIKLASLTQVVIDWVNNNDPTDFTEQIKQINDRMDEIETLVRALNLEEISTELEALRASVADAVSKAAQALTEAGQAKSNADQALTKAGQVETSLNAYKTSNDQALEDLEATLTETVSNADTKAEAAMTLADGADTNASNALTKANNALTKAEQAVLASGTAMNAAGEATAKAEAVEQALSGKQDVLTFDQAPTADSQNPVTSGGVYKAIRNAGIELDDNVTQTSQNGVKSSGIYEFVKENSEAGRLDQLQEQIFELSNTMQSKLTFDSKPKKGSLNPVTSNGIFESIQGSGGGTIALDDTVTAESQNGVKSSGIHAAIEAARTSLAAMITAANAVIESHTDDIAALHEFQTTQDTTNETHNTQIAANKKAVDDLTVKVTDNEESVNTRFTQLEGRLDTDKVLIDKKQNMIYSLVDNTRSYISEKVDIDLNAQPNNHKTLPTSLAVYNALTNKQDVLTFDQTPIADSQNPVTSGGVYAAMQEAGGGGKLKYTVLNKRFNASGVVSLPEGFTPMYVYFKLEASPYTNGSYDNLYVSTFVPKYEPGIFINTVVSYVCSKTDFRSGNIIGYDLFFTNRFLVKHTNNNEIKIDNLPLGNLMLGDGTKPVTFDPENENVYIYGFTE